MPFEVEAILLPQTPLLSQQPVMIQLGADEFHSIPYKVGYLPDSVSIRNHQ